MRFPWCEWRPIGTTPIPHLRDVTKLVLHRTEGSTVDGAWSTLNSRRVPSHGISDLTRGIHVQCLDTGDAARSLWHVDQDGCLQWEIVGFSRDTPSESDAWYSQLAALIMRVCTPHLIPAKLTSNDWPGSEGYGRGAPQRMSFDEFYTFEGVLAHQHTPAKSWRPNRYTNAHWDIGQLDVARLVKHLPAPENTMGTLYIDTEGPDEGRAWIVGGRELLDISDSLARAKHVEDYAAAGRIAYLRYAGDIVAKMYPPHQPEVVTVPGAAPPAERVEIPGAPVSVDVSPLSDADVQRIAVAVADEDHRRSAS